MKRLAVFCGSSTGNPDLYSQSCETLARVLVDKQIELVYGGGKVGLMGRLADAVLTMGGSVIGVIPERLLAKEIAHNELTELIVVKTMHERKAKMAELSDGFLALPGGIGTLEEIMEVFTWTQLGYHNKPCGLLNVLGFYDHLVIFLRQMVNSGFLREEQHDVLLVNDSPEKLVADMESIKIIYQDKWIFREGI